MLTYEGTYFLAVMPAPHKITFLIYTYLVGFQVIYLTLAGSLSALKLNENIKTDEKREKEEL